MWINISATPLGGVSLLDRKLVLSMPAVSTLVSPVERTRVDAAGNGLFYTTHRDTVDEVLGDLRRHETRAVIISTSICHYEGQIARIARVVREFPQVPTVALVTTLDGGAAR